MAAALRAQSVQQAATRAERNKRRVIPLQNPTMPPSAEEFWQRHWFAVFTLPGQEWRAMGSLANAGFCPFLPVLARWNGLRFRTKRAVEYPLLIRYLFVGATAPRLSDEERGKLRYSDGVHAVLGSRVGDAILPLRVPVENLVQLAGEIMAGAYDETRDIWGVDEDVIIRSGPFRSFPAKVNQTVSSTAALDEPVEVVLKILGRETIMHIPLADLERAQ